MQKETPKNVAFDNDSEQPQRGGSFHLLSSEMNRKEISVDEIEEDCVIGSRGKGTSCVVSTRVQNEAFLLTHLTMQ